MRSAKLVVGIVIGIILLSLVVVVILGDGSDDRCRPNGAITGGGGVPAGRASACRSPKAIRRVLDLQERRPARPPRHRPGRRRRHAHVRDGPRRGDRRGPASGFGNWIVIDHTIDGQPYSTVYGHMWDDGVDVQVGDTVAAGQHIGEVGNNGQSTGAHLHFEVWQGGRLTGGSETDPQPWLDRAANPGSGGSEPPTDESTTSRQPSPPSSGEMPDSDKIASKENLQVDSIRVARAVAQRFPDVKTIGGWRPVDAYPDHPSGRAVDIMIPDYSSSEGRELGNRITNYLLTHREFFNIEYLIWRQQYIPATGQPNQMEDRGDPTQNHFDHVHVTVAGGGKPTPEPALRRRPPPTGPTTPRRPPAPPGGDDCAPDFGHRSLNAGEIPAELRKWIDLGGQVCREVDSPLLAGLLYHESAGFQATAVSTAGAQGYGQFMPGTWAAKGAKVDDNGQIAGPPGSGSPSDPADATMAAARYLCEIAEGQREGIALGRAQWRPAGVDA
ncbi:peptidase M23, partial [Dietzia alimentaria]